MTTTAGGLCQACNLLAGLNAGKPRLGLTSMTAAPAPTAAAAAGVPDAHVAASGVTRADVALLLTLPNQPEAPKTVAATTLAW
jgi:hypothetical protein